MQSKLVRQQLDIDELKTLVATLVNKEDTSQKETLDNFKAKIEA